MKTFDEKLQAELDKLPFERGVDDSLYKDGVIDGFDLGARWAATQAKGGSGEDAQQLVDEIAKIKEQINNTQSDVVYPESDYSKRETPVTPQDPDTIKNDVSKMNRPYGALEDALAKSKHPTPSTHSEVGEVDLLNWLNLKVQSLNKSSSFYGYVNNVYRDQFEKEFSEWLNEYPTLTPQDDDKQNVFSRDECIFNYCPHPEECKDVCKCTADDLNKKIEKDNKVIEEMRDLSNIDMNAPYGSIQHPTPSTHSKVGEIEKAWRTYSDTFSNADTSGWQDLMDKESFFEAAKALTPTKPVEITEEEIDWLYDTYWNEQDLRSDKLLMNKRGFKAAIIALMKGEK